MSPNENLFGPWDVTEEERKIFGDNWCGPYAYFRNLSYTIARYGDDRTVEVVCLATPARFYHVFVPPTDGRDGYVIGTGSGFTCAKLAAQIAYAAGEGMLDVAPWPVGTAPPPPAAKDTRHPAAPRTPPSGLRFLPATRELLVGGEGLDGARLRAVTAEGGVARVLAVHGAADGVLIEEPGTPGRVVPLDSLRLDLAHRPTAIHVAHVLDDERAHALATGRNTIARREFLQGRALDPTDDRRFPGGMRKVDVSGLYHLAFGRLHAITFTDSDLSADQENPDA